MPCSGTAARFRLLPRFVAVSGLAGIAALLVGSLLDLFGADLDMLVYAAPMGVVELLVGGWLLVRPAVDAVATT
jgi:hypothetical protein